MIVFDFTKNDTANFITVIRHAQNIMAANENSRLEIVCHGPGLDLLLRDRSTVSKDIEQLVTQFHVVFAACEVTMRRRGFERKDLLPQAITVPAALLELSSKQEEGWCYIKEGY
jgi:intracellular sulfur oxidation DsrE/DsrF family protein